MAGPLPPPILGRSSVCHLTKISTSSGIVSPQSYHALNALGTKLSQRKFNSGNLQMIYA